MNAFYSSDTPRHVVDAPTGEKDYSPITICKKWFLYDSRLFFTFLSLDPAWISSHVRQSCFVDYKYLCDACLKLSFSSQDISNIY